MKQQQQQQTIRWVLPPKQLIVVDILWSARVCHLTALNQQLCFQSLYPPCHPHQLLLFLSAVEQIVRKTYKEEMRRRMSHGEILKLSETSNQPPSGFSATVTTGQVNHAMGLVTNNTNEYNAVMNGKPGYFKSNMMDRSQSSSSNTSR